MIWETVWTFQTKQFTVALAIAPDDDFDSSWMDEAELNDYRAGDLVAFSSRVEVTCNGFCVGSDYLGGSVYRRGEQAEFWTIGTRDYFVDMVREACRQARMTMRALPILRKA